MKKILISIAIISSLISSIAIQNNTAGAAPVVGFEAGRIIDDLIFTYYQSMTAQQIQSFLNSKMPTCDTWHTGFYGTSGTWYGPPFTCLKDYVENGKSSSQIIYEIAQTYRINPQVLIVLLQKEQGLVTDTWPASYQYKTATGYGCPDTAACDTQYYGFTNQVNNAARMFRKILDDAPGWYTPYELGLNYIQYNPNTGCGGTMVNIQNRSTQALYNYTPYQPNASALAAGYGSGDSCGAYGNRNFYLYFTDWFGSTYGANEGSLIRSYSANSGVYQIENGTKRPFPNIEAMYSYGYNWPNVITVNDGVFNQLPTGAIMPVFNVNNRNSQLIKEVNVQNAPIYLVENGAKRIFPSVEVFYSYNFSFNSAININALEFNKIPTGAIMPLFNANNRNSQLVKEANVQGAPIYLVENGAKRIFPSVEVFYSHNKQWSNVISINTTEFELVPTGAVMSYNVNYRNGQLIKEVNVQDAPIYLVENGTKRPFPSVEVFYSYNKQWSNVISLNSIEFNLIPTGIVMNYNTAYRDGQLIKEVNVQNAPIYLVENGAKRIFPSVEVFYSHNKQWSNVISINTTEFELVPTGAVMSYNVNYRNGQLIKEVNVQDAPIYLVENGTKRIFPSVEVFYSHARQWINVITINTTEINSIPTGLAMTYVSA